MHVPAHARWTVGLTLLCCYPVVSSPLETNLLQNPGFELGLFAWTTDHGAIRQAGPSPHGGTNYLMGANDGASQSYTYQNVDLIAAGFAAEELDSASLAVQFGGYQAGWSTQTDRGRIEIIVTDGSTELARADLGWFYSNYTWFLKEGTIRLPPGARIITYGFYAVRYAGSNNDGYLDDAFLELRSALELPRITAIDRTADLVTLQIANLYLGSTNTVFRSPELAPADWTQVGSFVAPSTVTNWSETLAAGLTQAFYRILSE